MEILPSEIVHNIFIQVTFIDRLTCTLVCRHWYNFLSKHSLLYDIEIKNDKRFKKFISMLQYLPSRASQVEILKLQIKPSSKTIRTFDKRTLCNLFPNLRVFEYDGTSSSGIENHCSKPLLQMTNSNSKIEILKDCRECELTIQLLMFGSCTRLQHLGLKLDFIDNPRKKIFVHLKSAPNLKKLNLHSCYISVDDLEIIHKYIPSLETLELPSLRLIPGTLPDTILPAISVTTLRFNLTTSRGQPSYLDWYTYMSKKYTHLIHFEWHGFNMLDLNPSEKLQLYHQGIFPIYKNMGIPLPSLHLHDFPLDVNPFRILDEYNLGVTHFNLENSDDMFEKLVHSNQPKHVELLGLHNIASPITLQRFTSLGKIYLSQFQPNFILSDIFDALPPTLTSFVARLRVIKINRLPSQPNNVQYLDIQGGTFPPRLGEVISNYFPKLTELYLNGRLTRPISLTLPANHFKNVFIEMHTIEGHGYVIRDANTLETRYMVDGQIRKDIVSETHEELQSRAMIDICYTGNVDSFYCDEVEIGSLMECRNGKS